MLRILSLGLVLPSMVASAQLPTAQLFDSVFTTIRTISLYTASVDWDSLRSATRPLVEQAGSTVELAPAMEALLNALRDHHGSVLDARTYAPLARFTDYDHIRLDDQRTRYPEVSRIVQGDSIRFAGTELGGGVGYLKVVGIAPNADMATEAMRIRQTISELAAAGVEHWVVDLRYNGGGNMHPMVAGLGPLIGEGVVGSMRGMDGSEQWRWEIEQGNFRFGGYQALELSPTELDKALPKVAVLMGRYTVSSGEVVATCFKGRPRTRFFGEASGGFATSNSWVVIAGEVIVNISTGYYADRIGTIYSGNMPVDEDLPFRVEPDPRKDEAVQTAVRWLRE